MKIKIADTVALAVIIIISPLSYGLDTDIYKRTIAEGEPKILVLLDTSASMRCDSNPENFNFSSACKSMRIAGGTLIDTGTKVVDTGVYKNTPFPSRMEIMKNIMNNFLHPEGTKSWPDSYQVGLAIFSEPGAAIIQPVRRLSKDVTNEIGVDTLLSGGITRQMTVRDLLLSELDALTETGHTPTMGALFEAASYMAKQAVVTGIGRRFGTSEQQNKRQFRNAKAGDWTVVQARRISHPDSFTGGQITPNRNNGGLRSDCFEQMLNYGPEYGRYTNACIDETIQPTGNLHYKGPDNDKHLDCADGENHIILVTDGFPFTAYDSIAVRDGLPLATWMKRFLTDDPNATGVDPRCPLTASSSNDGAWACMKAIAKKLKETHNTTIHIVSFLAGTAKSDEKAAFNLRQFKEITDNSKGLFISATVPEEIETAINRIATTFAKTANFASPSIAVDGLNQFSHRQAVNYSLFRPGIEQFWYGNLKRYQLKVSNGVSQLVDRFGASVIDKKTGTFKENVTSLWSSQPDGDNVLKGGAAALLDKPGDMLLFTDFSAGEKSCSRQLSNKSALRKIQSCSEELFQKYKREALIDVNSSDQTAVQAAIEQAHVRHKWVLGIDHKGLEWQHIQSIVDPEDLPDEPNDYGSDGDKERPWMGAVLHSSPSIVSYEIKSKKINNKETLLSRKDVIFVSTNDGHLYGINANKGTEVFRFIPEPMLNKVSLFTQRKNGDLVHGLDSSWTVWREDKPDRQGKKNGLIKESDGDQIALFGGMRRGGDHYYGLDLTSLKRPRLIFNIHGGAEGKTPSQPELSRLGQTWSQPELINVKINGNSEVLLAFGGGYDTAYDAPKAGEDIIYDPTISGNALGNAIYLVYAEGSRAGQVAAWASADFVGFKGIKNSDMTHSIPGRVATIDLGNNGYTDHIYFGDLGGQVFRVDINNDTKSVNHLIAKVQTLAKFGVTSESDNLEKNNRRFYEGPTVAVTEDTLINRTYLSVAISSGWRENPFETEGENRLYIIRDRDPIQLLRTGSISSTVFPVTNAHEGTKLINFDELSASEIDPNKITSSSKLSRAIVLTTKLDERGEKAFGLPLIAANKIFFSTLSSTSVDNIDSTTCSRAAGRSKIYGYSLLDAQGAIPERNENGDQINTTDQIQYTSTNAATDVTAHVDSDGATTIAAGTAIAAQLDPPKDLAEKINWRHIDSGNNIDRSKYSQ